MAQPQPQREKDAVRVDPEHYQVDQENDRVRVLRARYGPHEKSVMHSHPAVVAVFLKDCRFRMTGPDGHSEVREMRAGQVYCVGPEEHLPENLTGETVDVILVELKA
jgi:mannose-6-phosphate isomerase-like protein (cupin superfamily)